MSSSLKEIFHGTLNVSYFFLSKFLPLQGASSWAEKSTYGKYKIESAVQSEVCYFYIGDHEFIHFQPTKNL